MAGSERAVVVAAVGDFMLERRPAAADIRATRELLAGADLVIANVDVVLSDRGTPVPKWANLRGPREIAHDLRDIGIHLVAMANNHAMDFRAEGMLDTRRAYDEAGISHAGAGADLATATAPAIVETPAGRVAVLAVACTLPPESAAGANWPGIAPLRVRYAFAVDESLFAEQPGTVPDVRSWPDEHDLDRVRGDIRTARVQANLVLIAVHWGVPTPWRAPSHPVLQEYQRRLGRELIDAGADAVLGNHAHELHGIEFYRDRPIAYCLGNFWIDTIASYPWMGRESLVLRLALRPNAGAEIEVVPLYLDDGGVPRPDPDHRAIAVVNDLSHELGVTVEAEAGRFVVRPAG